MVHKKKDLSDEEKLKILIWADMGRSTADIAAEVSHGDPIICRFSAVLKYLSPPPPPYRQELAAPAMGLWKEVLVKKLSFYCLKQKSYDDFYFFIKFSKTMTFLKNSKYFYFWGCESISIRFLASERLTDIPSRNKNGLKSKKCQILRNWHFTHW